MSAWPPQDTNQYICSVQFFSLCCCKYITQPHTKTHTHTHTHNEAYVAASDWVFTAIRNTCAIVWKFWFRLGRLLFARSVQQEESARCCYTGSVTYAIVIVIIFVNVLYCFCKSFGLLLLLLLLLYLAVYPHIARAIVIGFVRLIAASTFG